MGFRRWNRILKVIERFDPDLNTLEETPLGARFEQWADDHLARFGRRRNRLLEGGLSVPETRGSPPNGRTLQRGYRQRNGGSGI